MSTPTQMIPQRRTSPCEALSWMSDLHAHSLWQKRPSTMSTEGKYGRYLTLSYVWGGDQVQKTTTSNISAYEHGIEPSLLPATIRDAIHATHALGFQSIWIDSLCIIQDSEEDKLRELGRMHLIYRHAFLTIIAASASGVTEGFLQERSVAPRDVSLPFICPPQPAAAGYSDAPHTVQQVGRMRASTTYTAAEGSLQSYTRALEPINTRGCSEDWSDVYRGWCRIVEDYSERTIGVPSDKLVACAAVAEMFSRVLSSEYLAGAWRATLLQDLLWRRDQVAYLHRATEYRAPSWSWAAVDHGRVEMLGHGWLGARAVAEVVRCEVALKDSELLFGQVSGASLVLRAPVVKCKFRSTDQFDKLQSILLSGSSARAQRQEHSSGSSIGRNITALEDQELPAWADIDEEADALPKIETALLVPLLQDKANLAMAGLVVVLVDSGDSNAKKTDVFRRIGKFYGYDWDATTQSVSPVPFAEVELV
ncbi:hypothetical protein VTO73DRAFT_15321 [Trametes versicolor]